MTDIFDMAARRTRRRIINAGPLPSRSRPASHVPAEDKVYEAPPWAGASVPASIPEQERPAAPEPVPSRANWVRAALASLLAALLMAGAYWYVTGVHVSDDPFVNVGESGISTDVSGIVENVDAVCASSSCERSPRSRLSPRAIVGRPESRQGNLHLAALLPSPKGMSADRHMLIGLQQGRGY
jgi:hypothetical protein